MDTDDRPDLRCGGEPKFLLKPETERIIGFAFEVLNEIGHGLHEKIYENALTVLFKQNNIAFDQQRRFPVLFRGVEVGEFIPDFGKSTEHLQSVWEARSRGWQYGRAS